MQQEATYYSEILGDHRDYQKYNSAFTKMKITGNHVMKIKELICVANRGKLDYYEKNRGEQGLNGAHIDKMVDEFDVDSLGVISMIFSKRKKRLMTVDGSHRMAALCYLAAEGFLDDFLDNDIFVKTVDEGAFLTTYQNINRSKSHSLKNVLTNRDLIYGGLIGQLVDQAIIETGAKALGVNSYTPIAHMMYALNEHKKNANLFTQDISYCTIHCLYARDARKDMRIPEPTIKGLKFKTVEAIVQGICIAMLYLDEVEKRRRLFEASLQTQIPDQHSRKRTMKSSFQSILESPYIIGYLICAGTRKIHQIDETMIDDVATEILKRATKLTNMCAKGRGSKADRFGFNLYLDRAIFGQGVKTTDLNYIVNV